MAMQLKCGLPCPFSFFISHVVLNSHIIVLCSVLNTAINSSQVQAAKCFRSIPVTVQLLDLFYHSTKKGDIVLHVQNPLIHIISLQTDRRVHCYLPMWSSAKWATHSYEFFTGRCYVQHISRKVIFDCEIYRCGIRIFNLSLL